LITAAAVQQRATVLKLLEEVKQPLQQIKELHGQVKERQEEVKLQAKQATAKVDECCDHLYLHTLNGLSKKKA